MAASRARPMPAPRDSWIARGTVSIGGALVGYLLLLGALVAGACGCASFPAPPVTVVSTPRASGLVDDRPPHGELQPGDELLIEVSNGAQSRQRTAVVDARGEMHAASGRDVDVAGMGLEQAQTRVAAAIHASDKLAQVSLQRSPRSASHVIALGALAKPGSLQLRPGMRVLDAVAAAGGLRTWAPAGVGFLPMPVADLQAAALVRDGKALPISLELALRGKPGHNVYLHPGDQLYVPFASSRSVSVLGQVGAPGAFPHRSGLRLTEALSLAGGVNRGGDKDDIRLVRGPVEAPKVYGASLGAIVDGKGPDTVLEPGDVVFVTDHPMEDVGEVVALVAPLASISLAVVTLLLVALQ
jgi:polysaccharide export outer membrane protein